MREECLAIYYRTPATVCLCDCFSALALDISVAQTRIIITKKTETEEKATKMTTMTMMMVMSSERTSALPLDHTSFQEENVLQNHALDTVFNILLQIHLTFFE